MSKCKIEKRHYPPCEILPIRVDENAQIDFYFNRFESFHLNIREVGVDTYYHSITFSSSKKNQAEVISLNNLTKHTGIATGKQINEFLEKVGV